MKIDTTSIARHVRGKHKKRIKADLERADRKLSGNYRDYCICILASAVPDRQA
jgi:hypothetical protein